MAEEKTNTEEPEGKEQEAKEKTEDFTEHTPENLKWQTALAYLPIICLIPLFLNRDKPEIQHHAKQGFILFMIELLALLLKIDAIWNLIILVCIAVAVVGALGILLRGDIKIPFLTDLADRIRI